MGHKVHPIGIRLGISKDWNSKWFANKRLAMGDKQVKLLGVADLQRSSTIPEVPTIAESGGPAGFVLGSWYGFFAPANVSADIMTKLHAEAVKALSNQELRERYLAMGVMPIGDTPEQFAATIRNDTARWAKVVKDAGITPE